MLLFLFAKIHLHFPIKKHQTGCPNFLSEGSNLLVLLILVWMNSSPVCSSYWLSVQPYAGRESAGMSFLSVFVFDSSKRLR